MKTLLSIGSGPGIGLATAERFAKEGFRVVLSARDADKAMPLADLLKSKGYHAEARSVDATDPAGLDALVCNVEREFGAIDVLHYNAALMRMAMVNEQPIETFNSDLAVNIGGALAAARAVSPYMIARNSGAILLTGGGFALQPMPQFISLSVGKAGIRALALGLHESMKAQGVHVATVTVGVSVDPQSRTAEAVADQFWLLYSQPRESWTAETIYSG
jgi:NAD(P)-dependent dehydrogenase (short-subunit alcohol dehydrogenase family)